MHVWLSGCRPAASGPPGFHTTARELQTCIFEGPGASNTTKIPREDPPERHKKSEMVAGEGEKARNFGPPTLRGPTLRGTEGCLFFCFFIFLFCFLKKKAKRKSDWPKSVKQRLATVGLAKVGISRIAVGVVSRSQRFWQSIFLHLVHPDIMIKEFIIAHRKRQYQFHKQLGQGPLSQKQQQISELQFDKFPVPQSFLCWKLKFKSEVTTFSIGGPVVESGDGRLIGGIEILAINCWTELSKMRCSVQEMLLL